MRIAAVVLAGGQSSRMGGGDKCLRTVGGRTMLAHLIERLAGQVEALAISANGDTSRFAAYGLPVLPDPQLAGLRSTAQEGPLAGIVAGLAWSHARGAAALLAVSGDMPFLPRTLATTLEQALTASDARAAAARRQGRIQPLASLWKTDTLAEVEALFRRGERAVKVVQQTIGTVHVDFDDKGHDPFQGANTPEELAALQRLWDSGAADA